jgi:hypothetical protein
MDRRGSQDILDESIEETSGPYEFAPGLRMSMNRRTVCKMHEGDSRPPLQESSGPHPKVSIWALVNSEPLTSLSEMGKQPLNSHIVEAAYSFPELGQMRRQDPKASEPRVHLM